MKLNGSTLRNRLANLTDSELMALKQQALHEAATYPVGSLRRRYWLGLVDRIIEILGQRVRFGPIITSTDSAP